MSSKKILLLSLIAGIIFSCRKDVVDLDMLSDQIDLNRSLAVPLIIGSLTLEDIIEEDDDSVLVIDGDTIKLHIRTDSILKYTAQDFVEIPDQPYRPYFMTPGSVIDVSLLPDPFVVPELIKDTLYILDLNNSMRADSAFLGVAYLHVNVENTFEHPANIIITSDDILDSGGNPLNRTVWVNANSTISQDLDISYHKAIFEHTPEGQSGIRMVFTPEFHKNPSGGNLLPSQHIQMEFGMDGLDDYEALYGFAGYHTYSYDTTFYNDMDILGLEMQKLSGSFQVTNPILNFTYIQSCGVAANLDLLMQVHNSDGTDVTIDPETKTINALSDPSQSPLHGEIVYTQQDNIDDLLSFPIPDSITVHGDVYSNYGLDSITTHNFLVQNSAIIIGMDVVVPLEFSADLTYHDTIELPERDMEDDVTFENIILHYWISNSFPIGFDAEIRLYDSVNAVVLDTIRLNEMPGGIFIKPAPVDANGIVIKDQVVEEYGIITLDQSEAENLLQNCTHAIFTATFRSTNVSSVKVLKDSHISFQFSIDAEANIKVRL